MSFRFEPTEMPEVVGVVPVRHADARGWFAETYRRSAFVEAGIDARFVQDNVASSRGPVLRGLHYQAAPRPQGKLVRALAGAVFDVAVDLREGSPTFARWVGRELTADGGEMLWIPEGFAHGYVVLTDEAQVAYKVTAEWDGALDRAVRWNDPDIGVAWPVGEPILSDKDRGAPLLADIGVPFPSTGSPVSAPRPPR